MEVDNFEFCQENMQKFSYKAMKIKCKWSNSKNVAKDNESSKGVKKKKKL